MLENVIDAATVPKFLKQPLRVLFTYCASKT